MSICLRKSRPIVQLDAHNIKLLYATRRSFAVGFGIKVGTLLNRYCGQRLIH